MPASILRYSMIFVMISLMFACSTGSDSGLVDGVQPDDQADGDSQTDGDEATDGDVDSEEAVDGDADGFSDGDFPDGDVADGDTTDGDDDAVTLELVEGCNPFSVTDECVTPFPSLFMMAEDADSPTGWRGNVPPDILPNKDGDTFFDVSTTNLADGSSPISPIILHFEVDIDPYFLNDDSELARSVHPTHPITLFNLETGERVAFMAEMDMNRRVDRYEGRHAFIIRPLEPMQMGARHAIAIRNTIRDADGNPLPESEAFAVLRDGIRTTNTEIEDARERYEELFTFLDGKGYLRDELFLAWDFQVASEDWVLGSVTSMREEALAVAATNELSYRIEEVRTDVNEYAHKLVLGQFEVPSYLNEENVFDYDADHHPVRQAANKEFPFTMVIPHRAKQGEPLPLVVFGHGIFGEGRQYLLSSWAGERVIHPLAENFGAIVIATDWIGLSGGDLNLIISEVVTDMNRIGLVTDRLQQSLINNLVMTEMAITDIQFDEQVAVGENDLIDADRVYYYGVSLGGIQGSSFVSLSPRVSRGVLAVPGSAWSSMLLRSIVWTNVKFFFDAEYPDPLTQQVGAVFMQTRFDHSDPINLTTLMFKNPLDDAPAERAVVLQEAIGDSQVPNMTTEALARAIGVGQLVPSVTDAYGLEPVESGTTESALVQYLLLDHLTPDNLPPEENVAPEVENNVHSDMVFLENVLEQVTDFLGTGVVNQHCEGVCDPN